MLPAGPLPDLQHTERSGHPPTPGRYQPCRAVPRGSEDNDHAPALFSIPRNWPCPARSPSSTSMPSRSRHGGVLPLRLGRQSVGLASPFAQPLRISPGIVPTDVDHRAIGASPARVRRGFDLLPVPLLVAHIVVVLTEGDLVPAQGERLRQGDRMRAVALVAGGAFDNVASPQAAHREASRRDVHHLRQRRMAGERHQQPLRLLHRVAEWQIVPVGPPGTLTDYAEQRQQDGELRLSMRSRR